ncbi:hypothetical protein K2173_018151 [Erythroxylum novogranatense]|uniref:Uncharacterized protein n=1 Tax=Erythroxylum novogranatense TaxID=1862640 RepID=A0AAV8TLG9_9ROSI|nr:hypothetical protein K2173_018151 [Erythroxylum novogranatense]
MNLIGRPLLAFLVLSVAATLVLKFSSPLFIFSLFNAIILFIVLGNHRPSGDEVEEFFQYSSQSSFADDYGDYVKDDNGGSDMEDDNEDRSEFDGSDGYDEDDDDDGSEGEVGWEDDEEPDENLESRIEDFIAKVIKGWREEWLMDNLHNE